MCNYYKIWVDKYGEVEAKRRQAKKTEKHRATQKAKMDSMTPEERSLKFGNSGVNNPMYGKTFYDVWLEKYGKDIADQKLEEWNIANNLANDIRVKRMTENNPSKLPGASERISAHRNKYYEDPNNREKQSAISSQLHQEGKLKPGYTKNFKHTNTIGETYIVQGSYELAFIKWLDANNMTYRCHADRITYTDDNVTRTYLPDFFVYEWDSYVDVKSTYWYEQQKSKFEKIFASNLDLKLKILLEHDLRDLSII